MKQLKYLNAVLTVIAFCLVLITLAVTGLISKANAKESQSNNRFATVPLNKDGSITVKFAPNETIDVNIDEQGGHNINYYPLPVEIQK